jgi:hypothetical protein
MVLDIQTVHHILKNTAVQNVNKPFVYITDLTSTLIITGCNIGNINNKITDTNISILVLISRLKHYMDIGVNHYMNGPFELLY